MPEAGPVQAWQAWREPQWRARQPSWEPAVSSGGWVAGPAASGPAVEHLLADWEVVGERSWAAVRVQGGVVAQEPCWAEERRKEIPCVRCGGPCRPDMDDCCRKRLVSRLTDQEGWKSAALGRARREASRPYSRPAEGGDEGGDEGPRPRPRKA